MKITRSHLLGCLILVWLIVCAVSSPDPSLLYQTSLIHVLLQGGYDGKVTLAELAKHGNFGIGTFNQLDGEMIVLDGKIYQVRSDGQVLLAGALVKTPLATVTFFKADQTIQVREPMKLEALQQFLDSFVKNKNLPYAIQIRGTFRSVKMRSVPKQEKPYPPLVEVTKKQSVFESFHVKGTIIGFRFPSYFEIINFPGYHLHFLRDDKKQGGHLLACELEEGTVSIHATPRLYLDLPTGEDFGKADLTKNLRGDLERAEK